jgi:hypothetical protein
MGWHWMNWTSAKRCTTPIIAVAAVLLGCQQDGGMAPKVSAGAPRALLGAPTPTGLEWLTRALQFGVMLSDDPVATDWTDEAATADDDDPPKFNAVPFQYDPSKTELVRARWLRGTGCPYNATLSDGTNYSDPACVPGAPKDKKNEGLLLVKTGPTPNNASAGVDLKGLKGITLTELGYDLRKVDNPTDPRGSHCGAGAPRFNVQTTDAFYFLGCNSPPSLTSSPGDSWQRLRWGTAGCVMAYNTDNFFNLECISGTLKSITIVFDEGTDTGPDNFGLAVLDNIDVNGQLVGKGPGN